MESADMSIYAQVCFPKTNERGFASEFHDNCVFNKHE